MFFSCFLFIFIAPKSFEFTFSKDCRKDLILIPKEDTIGFAMKR